MSEKISLEAVLPFSLALFQEIDDKIRIDASEANLKNSMDIVMKQTDLFVDFTKAIHEKLNSGSV